ncbi:unnamed protein product [Phytophthora fragariaefolia]|uniref:Unnamed protein product n=1 Tax=Phytophthora fragariaefolia TaxID=1490495 RepID=A0A9W6TPY3_9STRA|nr:unnamed protein product [Phytophthora fragariaefolia]
MSANPVQKRLKVGGRKPVFGALEDLLLDAIITRRLQKEKVTRDWIASAALLLYLTLDSDGTSFTGSAAWVSKFMKRTDLSLRRRTNLPILSDDVLVQRAITYMRYLSDLPIHCSLEHAVLMDKTAVFFEDPRDTTVDIMGARHVVTRPTGFVSMRVTVVLAVTVSGRKLTPLVIWKHKQGDRSTSTTESLWVGY